MNDATTDLDTIMSWARLYPSCNWGVTGAGRVFQIDIDQRKRGFDSWGSWLGTNGPVPETAMVLTGGGGRHLYFRLPDAAPPVGNKVNWLRGVDIRGEGGYVVAPGGTHIRGGSYVLLNPDTPVALAPDHLLHALRAAPDHASQRERLPDMAAFLDGVPEGHRDDVLFRMACRLRRRLGDDGRSLIELAVTTAAANCAPPFPRDQALAKVEQAFKMDHSDGAESLGVDGVRQSAGGNGIRFARRFGERVLYVSGVGWHAWDGSVWCPQPDEATESFAKEVVGDLYAQIQEPGLDSRTKARAARFAVSTDSPAGLRNMLEMARSDPGLLHFASDLNTDPLKLAVANGVVDIQSGDLLPLSRHDLITGRSAYGYDPACPRKRWEGFVGWAMCGDEALVDFVQRLAGYSITGLFTEHIFPVMLGSGGNGKNTFVETLVEILGPLAAFPFPADAITERSMEDKRTALLYGKRLAVISETNARVPINSATLKSYTGDGQMVGKWLYKDPFEFKATHTLWFMSNHRPKILDDSEGMWRRVLLVPWNATVGERQKVARYHHVMLQEEGPGIVAWLVEGARKYLADGLRVPDRVRSASQEYRKQEDVLGAFMDDCLTIDPDGTCTRRDLKLAYEWWCDEYDIPARERQGQRDLLAAIASRVPIDPNHRVGGAGARCIRGFRAYTAWGRE